MTSPEQVVEQEQEFLRQYLSMDVDVHDFSGPALWNWAQNIEELAQRDDETADDMDERLHDELEEMPKHLRKQFEDWLKEEWIPFEWREAPFELPAYVAFRNVNALPPGTWCIHFTRSDPFERFDRGTTIEGMHLSTWRKSKPVVDCGTNLSGDLGPYEIVYGFAFEATDAVLRREGEFQCKYGCNAVLFQTDGGVRAYHVGDEEWQVIFPLCSEYNVIPLYEPRRGSVWVATTEPGDDMEFDGIESVIEYVETEERRGRRRLTRNGPRLLRGWA